MNLQRLRYFKAVAEFRSLRKAAEALQVSQPALTRQIQILEHELKVQLFLRAHKRLTLTAAGELLDRRLGAILDAVDDVTEEIGALAQDRRTHISLGAIQSTFDYLLPRAIRVFRARYPGVQISVTGSRMAEIVERVGRRTLDIGIVAPPVVDPRLAVIPLAREPLVFVAAPSHPLAARPSLTLETIACEPFIALPPGYRTRRTIEAAAHARGVSLDVVVELESIEAIKGLLRDNAGVSLLPASAVVSNRVRKDLAIVPVRDELLVREVLAIHHAAEPVSAPVRFLRDAISEALAACHVDARAAPELLAS